jgi:hypothetical protein
VSRPRSLRHPVRGLFAGLALGLGAALQLIHHGRIAIGTLTPYAVVAIGVALGIAWSLLTPLSGARSTSGTPDPASAPVTPGSPPLHGTHDGVEP